jgi:uncharacterized protein YbaP (TraB family)
MLTRKLRLLPFVLLLLALVHSALAQRPATNANRHALWKIEGQRATVYLLGSVHFLKKENYPLAGPLGAAFDRAKIVAFETDMGALEDPKLQAKLMTQSALPDGATLRDQLPPKLYTRLADQLKDSGLPIEAVEKLKPGLAAMTLVLVEMRKLGLDETLGVDRHFHERAKKAGKEIMGLESAEFQLDLITGFSKAEGEALLDSTLKDIRTLREQLGRMIKSWETGDMTTLAQLMNEGMAEHPALFKRLLTDRNKQWVPKIEALARGDKDAIVIVGAGHLAGKGSVIDLLTKDGFKATQE